MKLSKIVIILMLQVFLLCSRNESPETVVPFVVKKISFPVYLYCSGKITPMRSKEFKAEKKGVIHFKIPIDENIEYKEGQNIAEINILDNERYTVAADLTSQKKELGLLKTQTALQEQLYKKGQISKNELERDRISLTRKKIELQNSYKKVANQILTAPFTGHLSSVSIFDNSETSEGASLFSWIDWNSIRIDMNIPDYHLRRIISGKKVIIEGGVLQKPINGTVGAIVSGKNESATGGMMQNGNTFSAIAHVNIDPVCIHDIIIPKGDVTCKYIDTVISQALAVPVEYLIFNGDQVYIKKTRGKLVNVKLGVVGDSLAEITSGITGNDTIIRSVNKNQY